ncbi:hypothetical protein FZW96_08280 [Bacillus sp. BGMRC 2118]|nr:hypothetical protein FZW96_08280 [Bacillus sp. BGMRC 2118]
MKKFFTRYSHWLALVIIAYNFISMIFTLNKETADILAVVFGGVGLIGMAFLTFYVEKQIQKKRKQNKAR